MVRLKKEDAAMEEAKLKNAQAKATRAQAKANKAVQGGTGQGTRQGGRGGRGGRGGQSRVSSGKGMSWETIIHYHSLIARLQSVVSDAEGEREGSEHDLEDPDWDQIDSYEAPRHQMGPRTRRMGKGGYREVVPEVEDIG